MAHATEPDHKPLRLENMAKTSTQSPKTKQQQQSNRQQSMQALLTPQRVARTPAHLQHIKRT
eukprot:840503-Pleurochrysis_carterae.AAC.1